MKCENGKVRDYESKLFDVVKSRSCFSNVAANCIYYKAPISAFDTLLNERLQHKLGILFYHEQLEDNQVY